MSKAQLSIATGRLRSIDALRGVAALAVLFFHALGGVQDSINGLPDMLGRIIATPLSFGYTGVGLFFVISGFCIHLRWAKATAAGENAKIDFVAFWKRRVFRLYPPYLIALGCYLFVLMLESKVELSGFFFFDLGTHLLMLHNVMFETAYSFNGAFWTLAIEEQLYLAYFLLLYLRRRLGWRRTLAICFGARVLWFALAMGLNPLLPSLFSEQFYYQSHTFHFQIPINEAALFHWFTWALGAFAIEGAVGLVRMPGWCRSLSLALAALIAAAVLAYFNRSANPDGVFHYVVWLIIDPLWGLGFFCIVNRAVAQEPLWRSTRMPRLVTALAAIGIFSYSLYLMHEFVLIHFLRSTSSLFGVPENYLTLFSLLVLAPVSIAFSWVFFQLFEKPFIAVPARNSIGAVAEGPRAPRLKRGSLILRRVTLAILALFVLSEIGLRLYNHRAPNPIFYDDSYNRLRGRPFAPDYDFRLNSKGFKDAEFRPTKDENTVRILGIGNLSAYTVVPYRYSYLTALEERLNKGGGRFEVINMAIPYISPKDYLALLMREGLDLNPDLIIVSLSIKNDLSGYKEEAKINSYLASYLSSASDRDERYEGQIFNGNTGYNDNQPVLTDEEYLNVVKEGSDVYVKGNNLLQQGVAYAMNYLIRMKQICDDRQIKFAVVLVPDEVQVNSNLQAEVIRASKSSSGEFDFALPNKSLSSQLKAYHIDHLDLLDEFARASGQMSLYKPNYGHWNIAGNRLAAELIQKHISAGF